MFSLANHTGGRWSAVHRLLAVSFIAVILIWAVVRPIAPARIFKAEPVWGAKPVLGYFALTPSLKGPMMEGGALNPLQYQTIRRVAELEVEELRASGSGEPRDHPRRKTDTR